MMYTLAASFIFLLGSFIVSSVSNSDIAKRSYAVQTSEYCRDLVSRSAVDAVDVAVRAGMLSEQARATAFAGVPLDGPSTAELRTVFAETQRDRGPKYIRKTLDAPLHVLLLAVAQAVEAQRTEGAWEAVGGELGLERVRRKTGGSLDSVAVEDAVAYLAVHSYLQAVPELEHVVSQLPGAQATTSVDAAPAPRTDLYTTTDNSFYKRSPADADAAARVLQQLAAVQAEGRAWLRTSPTARRLQAAGVAAELDALAEAHRHRSAHRLSVGRGSDGPA
jgi:hypothetical protein